MVRPYLLALNEIAISAARAREHFVKMADTLAAALSANPDKVASVEKIDEGFYFSFVGHRWFFAPQWRFDVQRIEVLVFSVTQLPECAPEYVKIEGDEILIDRQSNLYVGSATAHVGDPDDVAAMVIRKLGLFDSTKNSR